jgi:hypothetical protein
MTEQTTPEATRPQEYEITEISDARTGGELLDRLPGRFERNTTIELRGKVRGRDETQTVEVRTDVEEIKLDENKSFWALKAVWSDGTDSLLMNGKYFDRDDEEMRYYTTTRGDWDWKKEGQDLIGKLTLWDGYNIGRFEEVSHATVKTVKEQA